jgi:hypothetical protein
MKTLKEVEVFWWAAQDSNLQPADDSRNAM